MKCCELMCHALKHGIIRTNPTRFGPDVLDHPLQKPISFCPWCGTLTVPLPKITNAMIEGYIEKADMKYLESQIAATLLKERKDFDRLRSSIHAAHGLLAPLGNQVTPSLMAIREVIQILRNTM